VQPVTGFQVALVHSIAVLSDISRSRTKQEHYAAFSAKVKAYP